MKRVAALTLVLSGALVCVGAVAETGVTVIDVLESSEARTAAILPGDVFLRWKPATDQDPSDGDNWQPFSSPLDVLRIETLLLSALPVRIELLRADQLKSVTVSGGSLGIFAGPRQIDGVDTYREMRRAKDTERIELLEALIDSGTIESDNLAWSIPFLLSDFNIAFGNLISSKLLIGGNKSSPSILIRKFSLISCTCVEVNFLYFLG
jgi:hypothetical protein